MKRLHLLIVLMLPVMTLGCPDHKPLAGERLPLPPVVPRKVPVAEKAPDRTQEPLGTVRTRCNVNRKVGHGDFQTAGGALYVAYQAALKGDSPESFQAFSSAFRQGVDRQQLQRFVWPAVLRHVSKYVAGPGDPSYILCSMELQDNDRVKIHIKSHDSRKSNPPAILVKEGENWMIEVLTP